MNEGVIVGCHVVDRRISESDEELFIPSLTHSLNFWPKSFNYFVCCCFNLIIIILLTSEEEVVMQRVNEGCPLIKSRPKVNYSHFGASKLLRWELK